MYVRDSKTSLRQMIFSFLFEQHQCAHTHVAVDGPLGINRSPGDILSANLCQEESVILLIPWTIPKTRLIICESQLPRKHYLNGRHGRIMAKNTKALYRSNGMAWTSMAISKKTENDEEES